MCSCSGSCNCNSTTIPRGPQGAPGLQGAKGETGNPGTPGGTGATGNDGKNAYTTQVNFFIQPAPNDPVTITVVNSSWAAVDQIIFVGNSSVYPQSGGFYKVVSTPLLTEINVIRMDWTIPGVTFRPTGQFVGGTGTLITSSGTIGPIGDSGVGITEIQNQGILVTAPLGTYTAATTVTTSNQICTSNGAMAKFVFIVSTFSSFEPTGPKPYFSFNINSVTASIRSGTLAVNEIKLDVTSSPSFATMEFTIKRLSQTSAVCFVKAYLDSAVGTKSIANYIGDVSINPIDIDFAASNTFNLLITLPQTMSYSLVSSWVEEYKS